MGGVMGVILEGFGGDLGGFGGPESPPLAHCYLPGPGQAVDQWGYTGWGPPPKYRLNGGGPEGGIWGVGSNLGGPGGGFGVLNPPFGSLLPSRTWTSCGPIGLHVLETPPPKYRLNGGEWGGS